MVDSRLVQPSPFTCQQLDARLTQVEEMSDFAEPVTSDVFAFEV